MFAHHRSALIDVVAMSLALLGVLAPATAEPITINHSKALAGAITPGDDPGFPVTITLPGSYILTSSLHPPMNRPGIEIKAFDVTIDFNGFRLGGNFRSDLGVIGFGAVNTITLKNGLIVAFNSVPVRGADSWTIENMRISANGSGLQLGKFARLQNNTITLNGSVAGISCGEACHVEGNVVSQNRGIGISIHSGTVLGNTIANNRDEGIRRWNASASPVGYGNNTLFGNNSGGAQVSGASPIHLNVCSPAC